MTSDIPNAFIQASMPVLEKGEDRVIMKVKGALLEILVSLPPNCMVHMWCKKKESE